MNEDPFPTVNRKPVPPQCIVGLHNDLAQLDQFYLLDGVNWDKKGAVLVGYKVTSKVECNQLIADAQSRQVFFINADEFNSNNPEQHLPQPIFKRLIASFWQALH